MKYLLLFLLIPSAFAESPPACGELGTIVQEYEQDLQKASIKNCASFNYQELLQNTPYKDSSYLEDKKCLTLNALEAELEKLKVEEAVLMGIDKLKAALQSDQRGAGSANQQVARVSGKSFVTNLDTAQSLEVLLGTTTEDNSYLIQKLKESSSGIIDQLSLSTKVKELCKGKTNAGTDACNPKVFHPGPEAAREIIDLIKGNETSVANISRWQKQLAIERLEPKEDDESYSFQEMRRDLEGAMGSIDNKQVMTKSQLLAIQELPKFKNKENGLSYVEEIFALKDTKKAKIASDKFILTLGDAKTRQQLEVMSKVSVAYLNFDSKLGQFLSEGEKATCLEAKSYYPKAKECLGYMNTAKRNVGDSEVESVLGAIEASAVYADKLASKEESCKMEVETTEKLSPSCYTELGGDLTDIKSKIIQLNVIKERIGLENQDKMKFRNFALQKWGTQKCKSVETPMELCEEESTITKGAFMTLADSMQIAIVYSPKSEAEKEAEDICDDDEVMDAKGPRSPETRLCAFFNDTTPNVIETKNEDNRDGPTAAPDGNHMNDAVKDAWIGAGASVLGDALRALMPKTTPPTRNPYPMNFGPYNGGKPLMGISDTILFNARYQGAYGFYMPTPGYQPGTAFGSNVSFSGYKPASVSSSKYFSF